MTKGSASGLRSRTCISTPAMASTPPAANAVKRARQAQIEDQRTARDVVASRASPCHSSAMLDRDAAAQQRQRRTRSAWPASQQEHAARAGFTAERTAVHGSSPIAPVRWRVARRLWNNPRDRSEPAHDRFHRCRRLSRQRRNRPDARRPPGLPRRPHRRPRLAISPRRRAAARDARRGAVPRAQGRDRPRPRGCEARGGTRSWLRYRLPQAIRPQEQPSALHRPEAALVPAATASARRTACDLDSTSEPEFERWRWVDYWTPVREVIYFKRAVYARALDELARTCLSATTRRRCRNGPSRRSICATLRAAASKQADGLAASERLHHRPGSRLRSGTASALR